MPWVEKRPGRTGTRYIAVYRDPAGRKRSAGTFSSRRAAERAAHQVDEKALDRSWVDPHHGKITFRRYVEEQWWPSRHLEVSTRAAYRSYLDGHFLPYFGDMPLSAVLPTTVQGWVTAATAGGLSPRSVRKYHALLHSIFRRAVKDRLLPVDPAADTELPKVVPGSLRVLTPEEFDLLLAQMPVKYQLLMLTAIETGLRWGELIALRPASIDVYTRSLHVRQVYIEVSRKHSPTGQRMILKEYPKDDRPRTLRISTTLLAALAAHITAGGLRPPDLLWSTEADTPISRNTFRTRIWLPAQKNARLGFHVRWHDLRHAHASWLLAGGADLKTVMDRMGHSQITTTQRYLHTLPDADDQAIAAFDRTRHGRPAAPGVQESVMTSRPAATEAAKPGGGL